MTYKPVRRPFAVVWRWRTDESLGHRFDRIESTDAERAISKLYRDLSREYVFSRRDVIVVAAYPEVAL